MAIGWSQSKLAARIGCTQGTLSRLMVEPLTFAAIVRQVRAVYDELWDQLPPEEGWRDKIAASRARNHAQAMGWHPPLAWDDDLLDTPDDELEAAIERLVERMDDDDLARAHGAYWTFCS